ncbi:MAG: radical SAM protein [Deltaproteobacteria bacterium]|jgi:DNA repair photolyase|nr:radical SAM protein [Deltaproteobacteria bacterium]MBW2535463.1 radical SAM protein [Deltaproteobacteria bacterium]
MPSADTGQARYREVDAKSITRLRGTVDPWFLGRYGMNLYRGCEQGCVYCDGRAERYYVKGSFDRDIAVKHNAVGLLRRELGRAREPGFVLLGGGVCDAYQPAEERYELARGVLQVALELRLPVHVLTKSSLVERDLDLLRAIDEQSRAILSFSIQTVDDEVRARFEPRAAPMSERLRIMSLAKQAGLGVGAMAMPVLPGISDTQEQIDELVGQVADAGADFVCFGGLTLRPGVQRDTYLAEIRQHHPDLLRGYRAAYRSSHPSGAPDRRYAARVDARFHRALGRHRLPGRAPRRLFAAQMPLYAEVAVLLEHRQLELRMAGAPGRRLGAAGFAIQKWARDSLSKRGRRKGFSYRQLEEELRQRVADGSIVELPGVHGAAQRELRRLLREGA